VRQEATSVGTPIVADSGIPFFIGAAPVQSAANPAPAGEPVLCTSWDEAKERFGFADFDFAAKNWKYNLSECMYSHFKLFGMQPAIICNLLDPASMASVVAATDIPVSDKKALLPLEAINDGSLVVKAAGGSGDALVLDTDYSVFYSDENLTIALLSDGAVYSADQINVEYKVVTPASVTPTLVATGMENIEKCMTSAGGVIPDLVCAPSFSQDVTVAAVMATKTTINGLFGAKALIDISSAATGATSYTAAAALKNANNLVDPDQIVCWPMLRLGDRIFHMSTQMAGLIPTVDNSDENGGIPVESPSNKEFKANGMVLEGGAPLTLTHAQANILNANGICTALNFLGGWVAWGNYNACYPMNNDVKDYFIPISRMFDWVGNTVVKTFWKRLDKPMNERRRDNIIDTCNIWLNGVVGAGFLLGARVEVRPEDNPLSDLMAGIIKVRIYLTPAGPMQEIVFILEYDHNYVTAAFAA